MKIGKIFLWYSDWCNKPLDKDRRKKKHHREEFLEVRRIEREIRRRNLKRMRVKKKKAS